MKSEDKQDKIIQLMRTDDSVDAPADAIRWAKNLFLSHAPEPKPSLIERVLGVLKAEIAAGKPAFGERSAGAGQARQLLYSAGDDAVDIRIIGSGKKLRLAGQVIGGGFENAVITLSGTGDRVATANELAEFEFETIEPGIYMLTITGNGREIVIEQIELGK